MSRRDRKRGRKEGHRNGTCAFCGKPLSGQACDTKQVEIGGEKYLAHTLCGVHAVEGLRDAHAH
jgi:hypothetical protein